MLLAKLFWIVSALGPCLTTEATYAAESGSPLDGKPSIAADVFLSSLGVNTHVSQGYNAGSYVLPLRYLGVRAIRDGGSNPSGLTLLHNQTGVRIDLIAADIEKALATARQLARVGALLSIEGPNEPNNFPIVYQGRKGGGQDSWVPVAEFQRDLYRAVKSDEELKGFPVFHLSEGGAEVDNVGLQFVKIPKGAKTILQEDTQFSDYANAHNYVSGNHIGYVDNQAWQAADPALHGSWDGLYVEYGTTWKGRFSGYSLEELRTLPRVTTETGWEAATREAERIQGIVLVNTYLAQFARGWRYTFVYQLGESEGGGGKQGLFHDNWTPKLAASYIHNLTAILADSNPDGKPDNLKYEIANRPETVHELLLKKSSGVFELVVWGEQVAGSNDLVVNLGNSYSKVNIYDPTIGLSPIQVLTNVSSVPLTVSDHAFIIEIE